MKCNERRDYHHMVRSCSEFDDMIELIASKDYFKIVGRKPKTDGYLRALCDRRILPKMAELAIVKKTRVVHRCFDTPG